MKLYCEEKLHNASLIRLMQQQNVPIKQAPDSYFFL